MSAPGAAATAPQQINVADLELPQLGEVKKQLEEACCRQHPYIHSEWFALMTESAGTLTSNQLIRTTETSTVEIPLVHREREGGQARKQR